MSETPEREFGGYPVSCIRKGWFQLESEQVMAIITDLMAALDKAEQGIAKATTWIPVSEPPPETEALTPEYLTYSPKWRGCSVQVFTGKHFLEYGEPDDSITHWMPLPEAPK